MARNCPVCEGPVKNFLTLKVLGSIDADYFRCETCAFIFAPNPYWLDETFTDELNSLDIGSLDRCLIVADFVETFIRTNKISRPRVLDWGGGYGALTRVLRDRGIDAYVFDPFVEPIFASRFTDIPGSSYDLIVLSEVMLHIVNPIPTLRELADRAPCVLFTAVVPPDAIESNWWYLMPDSGQHVAFYPTTALDAIGESLDIQLTSDHRFFHVLHRQRLTFGARLILRWRPLAFGIAEILRVKRQLLTGIGRSKSLLAADQEEIRRSLPWNHKRS